MKSSSDNSSESVDGLEDTSSEEEELLSDVSEDDWEVIKLTENDDAVDISLSAGFVQQDDIQTDFDRSTSDFDYLSQD